VTPVDASDVEALALALTALLMLAVAIVIATRKDPPS
jgi:hypothetical protein